MLRRGFLANERFYATLGHTGADVDEYLAAVNEAFALMASAIRNGDVTGQLEGPVKMSGFKRLN